MRLDRISVQLRHVQHAAGSDMKDSFERIISLDGKLSTEERRRLLTIAERCPVSETLKRSADITSRDTGARCFVREVKGAR
jgi:putative redox protein